jgi:subtilisin family serine protease
MKLRRTLTLFTLTAVSATVVGCSTRSANLIDPGFDNDISSFATEKADPYANLRNGEAIPGEFIVKFKPNVKPTNALSALGATPEKNIGNGMVLVKAQTGINVNSFRNNASVLWSEPNRVIRVPRLKDVSPIDENPGANAGFPNDPMFNDQYSHKVTQAQEGWKISTGQKTKDLIIAIVDTGVDAKHPDLAAKIVPGHSSYPGEDPGVDKQGHGTHCAGIASAIGDNKVGVIGVSPFTKIQPVKVLNDQGSGTYAAVAEGMVWAASNGAKVMSMSLGGPSNSQAMVDAVNLAVKNDVLVVVAMGNDGDDSISYPAGIKGVMAVGATDSSDAIASFSQYGPHISVSAPGVKILSTFPTYKNAIGMLNYGKISGTSMATPYVSGLAGLVRATFPNLDANATRAKIEKSADDLGEKDFDVHYGWGRVNVAKALAPARR